MRVRDIVVIGASSGGIEALLQLVRNLPADLPAAIFVVVHIWRHTRSVLPDILGRACALEVKHASDGEHIRKGHIYVAPPDWHMRVGNPAMSLSRGPHENGFRPAIDPLFRSAAQAFGPRVIGIILSGAMDDGSLGIDAVKRAGGLTVVQDPADAAFIDMPMNAINDREIDHVLTAAQIGRCLREWVMPPAATTDKGGTDRMSDETKHEDEVIRRDFEKFTHDSEDPSDSSVLTCPECGGAIWAFPVGDQVHYRCHVGHAYSLQRFLSEQFEAVESALWTAVRALEEQSALLSRMVARAAARGSRVSEESFAIQAREAKENAGVIRALLMRAKPVVTEDPAAE